MVTLSYVIPIYVHTTHLPCTSNLKHGPNLTNISLQNALDMNCDIADMMISLQNDYKDIGQFDLCYDLCKIATIRFDYHVLKEQLEAMQDLTLITPETCLQS